MDITRNVAIRKRNADDVESEVKSNQVTRSEMNTNSLKLFHRRYSHPDLTGCTLGVRESETSQKPNEVIGILDAASQHMLMSHQNQGKQIVPIQNHSSFENKADKGADKDMDEGCAISGRLEIRVLQKNPNLSDNKEKYAFCDTDNAKANSLIVTNTVDGSKADKNINQIPLMTKDTIPAKQVVTSSLVESGHWKKTFPSETTIDDKDNLYKENVTIGNLNSVISESNKEEFASKLSESNDKDLDNAVEEAKNSNIKYFDKKEINVGSKIPVFNANVRTTKCASWSGNDYAVSAIDSNELTPGNHNLILYFYANL